MNGRTGEIVRSLLLWLLCGLSAWTVKTVVDLSQSMAVVQEIQRQQAEDHRLLGEINAWRHQHEGETKAMKEQFEELRDRVYAK